MGTEPSREGATHRAWLLAEDERGVCPHGLENFGQEAQRGAGAKAATRARPPAGSFNLPPAARAAGEAVCVLGRWCHQRGWHLSLGHTFPVPRWCKVLAVPVSAEEAGGQPGG